MNEFTVIFDMDGVILDSERVYQEIEHTMYKELGIQVSREEHQKFMGTAELFMWTCLHEHYQLDKSVEELIRTERERFMDKLEIKGGIPLMKGLIPLLASLQEEGIPCWIASSSAREIISKVLDVHNLAHYFCGFVSGEDVQHSKPSPEIFLRTAELAGASPSDCIVIEDSENGIKAARAAGMVVVALRHPDGGHLDLSQANQIIDSLVAINPEGLHCLLKKLRGITSQRQ